MKEKIREEILQKTHNIDRCIHDNWGGDACNIEMRGEKTIIKCRDCNKIFYSALEFADDIKENLMNVVIEKWCEDG